MKKLTRYAAAAFDLLMPRNCIVCGRRLNVDEFHLCLYCMADIPFTRYWKMDHNPMADRLNMMIQKGVNDGSISAGRELYAYAVSLFFYDSEAGYRYIPYQVKYHGNISVGRFFGRMLASKIKETAWAGDVDVVVPVPLHWRRKWSRGYNQAEIIAAEVAAFLEVPMMKDMLVRSRYTKTQTKLEVGQKEANVSGAFAVADFRNDNINHILLIDDVFTTGATLCSCYIALRKVFPTPVRISVATLGFVG